MGRTFQSQTQRSYGLGFFLSIDFSFLGYLQSWWQNWQLWSFHLSWTWFFSGRCWFLAKSIHSSDALFTGSNYCWSSFAMLMGVSAETILWSKLGFSAIPKKIPVLYESLILQHEIFRFRVSQFADNVFVSLSPWWISFWWQSLYQGMQSLWFRKSIFLL